MPLRSMTGYGVCEELVAESKESSPSGAPVRLQVELRSVNSRFLDLKIRQPFGAAADHELRRCVEAAVGRGRVDVQVSLERGEAWRGPGPGAADAALTRVGVAPERLRAALDAFVRASALARQEGLEVLPVNPLELLEFSRRTSTQAAAAEEAPRAPAGLLPAVQRALSDLVAMREREGGALATELAALVDRLEAVARSLSARVAGDSPRLRAAVEQRLAELQQRAPAGAIDETRLAQEVALLAVRGDVREELARIDSHLAQFRGVLSAPAAAGQGKRLEFLAQELLREVTTVGGKIASHEGSASVIDAKTIVERIREQVQNVE